MKRTGILLTLSLVMSLSVIAQDKPKSEATPAEAAKPAADAKPAVAMPTVDEVLDKYIKSLGGKEAIEKITSRASKGTMELEAMGMNGAVEMFEKAPNRNAMVIDLPGFGKINNVFDGEKGYSSDPMSGARELSGSELAAAKRDADFYSVLNMKKNFKSLELKGKEKVGASEVFVVLATPAEGEPEKYFFDAASGLLVRQDTERESPQGKMAIEMYFEDYKSIDGMKMPHLIRQVTPAFTAVIKLSEVKVNAPIEDTKFAKPSSN